MRDERESDQIFGQKTEGDAVRAVCRGRAWADRVQSPRDEFRGTHPTTSTRCSTLSKNTYVDKNKPHRVCWRFVVPRGMLSPSTVMSASSRSLPVPIIKQVTLLRLFPSLVTRSPARGGDARAPTFYPEPEPDLAAKPKKAVRAGVFAASARFFARNFRRSAKFSLLYLLTFTMP